MIDLTARLTDPLCDAEMAFAQRYAARIDSRERTVHGR